MLILLAGCTLNRGDDPDLVVTATPAPLALAALRSDAVGPDSFPVNVNPLTGLAVDLPGVLQRRPLAIKISNAPDSVRPQAGISAADLVFEHYTEGRLTRFTAIFWTHTPPRVGSVRSARLIDLEIPAMYGALLAYSGASEPIRQRIAALPFAPRAYEGVSVGEPLYFRDPALEPPHNLFVVPVEVWRRASQDHQNQPPALKGMAFSPTPLTDGYITQRITINYGPDVVRWDYAAATGRYARTSDGQPHRDANTGEQVSAANVVILFAHHQEDLSIVESEWQGHKDFSIEIQLWTLGPAVLIRDGQRVEGWWMRWEENDLISLWANEQGTQRLYLKPGNTWFQVVPLDFSGLRYN
ncbi:MAG: DUF3048 domain-containing protein [Chloroflexi bacterium]|nr:DUF3048 domain-containing protein [Chloroflexota bacterium]